MRDPSNDDEKFLRIRVRKLIEELKRNGLNNKKLEKTIENLKSSNSVVEFYTNMNLKKNAFLFVNNNKIILKKEFFEQPYEVIFRSISNLIKLVGKKHYSARGKKIDRIITDLKKRPNLKVTLGGCILEKVNQSVIIRKEHKFS